MSRSRDGIYQKGKKVYRRDFLGGFGAAGLTGLVGNDLSPAVSGTPTPTRSPTVSADPAILVVSLTPGFRHEVIPKANQTIKELGDRIAEQSDAEAVTVDVIDSEDESTPPTAFPTDADDLARYDVVVFNNSNDANPPDSTNPVVLSDEQADAFEEYIRDGGGFVGIHSAVDNQTDGSFFNQLIGTYFESHPQVQEGTIHVTDRTHPSTDHLPAEWELTAEWYDFTRNPRGDVHVLCTADESSYENAKMDGLDHPMSWCQPFAGGRSWYTALGHLPEQYEDENFREHLLGGIMWAAGYVDGDATGTVWDHYTKVPIDTETKSPSMLEVAPDGQIFYIERANYNEDDVEKVVVVDQTTPGNESTIALELSVYGTNNGLKGIGLDPDFGTTGWIYVYYAPPSDEIDEPHNRLSRFTVEGDVIDPDSEVPILEVPVQREAVGHYAGDIEFGPGGELYLTLGDATSPFESSGYAPIDEREEREPYDAQSTSSNTAALGGSILRIVPEDDGSYTVPEDNLFTESNGYGEEIEEGVVRPELFSMGVRNPYRGSVDPKTGALYWGDYGPDAGTWNPQRGPPAVVEINRATEPGFYGWPYFVGPNVPFVDYDFATGESGDPFDPEDPRNDSPNNDGLLELPPAEEAMIYYPRSWDQLLDAPDYADRYLPDEPPFPELRGATPMVGPLYRHRDDHDPKQALPRSFDGKLFVWEWATGRIKYVSFDDEGNPMKIDPFLPDTRFESPMDMDVGPDGALYVAEWGTGYEAPNHDSGIYRIEHSSVLTPSVVFTDGNEVVVDAGTETTVEATLTNTTESTLESGDVTFSVPADSNVEVSEGSGTSFDSLAQDETQSMSLDVTVPDSSSGSHTLTATTTYTLNGERVREATSFVVRVRAPVSAPFGLNLGDDDPVTVDGLEFVTLPHLAVSVTGIGVEVVSTDDPIQKTEHDALYRSAQRGMDLGYDILVENGTYDVTLHFVEEEFEVDSIRVFDVSIQGETVIEELDIFDEAGGHDTALAKTVRGVRVSDGTLSISTDSRGVRSSISGIEIRSADGSGTLEGGSTIELDGETDGWIGVSPGSIEGRANPTLQLQGGETYTVTWENADGAPHDFYVLDSEGNELVGTDIVTEQGQTASVEFVASREMAEYYCSVHPERMRGDVAVREGTGDRGDGDAGDGDVDSGDGGDTETTSTETPGMGILAALSSLAGGGYLLARRRSDREDP